jgi:hypothetical protein
MAVRAPPPPDLCGRKRAQRVTDKDREKLEFVVKHAGSSSALQPPRNTSFAAFLLTAEVINASASASSAPGLNSTFPAL